MAKLTKGNTNIYLFFGVSRNSHNHLSSHTQSSYIFKQIKSTRGEYCLGQRHLIAEAQKLFHTIHNIQLFWIVNES